MRFARDKTRVKIHIYISNVNNYTRNRPTRDDAAQKKNLKNWRKKRNIKYCLIDTVL